MSLLFSVNVIRDALRESKNCECCHQHSLFKGHNVNVNIVVLNYENEIRVLLSCQETAKKEIMWENGNFFNW